MCDAHGTRSKRCAEIILLTSVLTLGQPASIQLGEAFEQSPFGNVDPLAKVIGQIVPHASAATAANDGGTVKWTCPMHPHYIADEFGACPICGMDLVKLDTGNGQPSTTSVETRSVITVSPEVVQSIGVRLAKAEASELGREVRSFGIVQENERLQTDVTARVEGWVEDLRVTAVGDEVDKGTILFELYSPQLIVSQNDYMRSRASKDLRNRGLAQLRAFGVQQKALGLMKDLKRPMERVPFYADRKGTISELNLRQGTYVKRGMMLAKIQDYSEVWLMVSVAEKDLGFVKMSTPARVKFPNLPGRDVQAKVDYIYPTIDPKTRTGKVRLVVKNSDGLLRPGSYADVTFEVGNEQRIAVPTEAILENGDGRFVVASLGQGRFEPRIVETGLTSGRWTEVKRGVTTGEDIVVSGQFLLDSESALRESFRKLQRLQLPLSLLKLEKTQFAMVDHLIDAALYLHEALADGYDVEAKFLEPAISIRDLMWPRFKDTQLAFVLEDSVAALREAQKAQAESEIQAALAKLAAALRPWILIGAPDHYRERKVALYKEKKGKRVWLQQVGKPINPYSRESGQQVPWPESKSPNVVAADTPSTKQSTGVIDAKAAEMPASQSSRRSQSMRGSHSGN